MSVEPWSIERPHASPDDARTVARRLADDDGRLWSCRKVAELVVPEGTARLRQVVLCTPDDGSPAVHLRVLGDWASWPEPVLLDAIRRARVRRDD